MTDRESILPLLFGALLALALHVVLVPAAAHTVLSPRHAVEPLADLAVQQLTAPPAVDVTARLDVRFRIANIGTAATVTDVGAAANWVDRLYLSRDDQLDEGDLILAERPAQDEGGGAIRLGADGGYNATLSDINLPVSQPGRWHLILVTDARGAVKELTEKNNIAVAAIEVEPSLTDAPLPDLSPRMLVSPNEAHAGATIRLALIVNNTGEGPAAAPWADGVYLSDDEWLSANDVLIAAADRRVGAPAGASYTQELHAVLSLSVTRDTPMFLIGKADHHDVLLESTKANNLVVQPILIRPQTAAQRKEREALPPDLEVVTIRSPRNALNGERIEVEFLVRNRGGAMRNPKDELAAVMWRDGVYLSADDQLSEDDAQLAAVDNAARLAGGAHYWARAATVVRAPKDFDGRVWLIVKTDAEDGHAESREDNNVKAVPLDLHKLNLGKEDAEPITTIAWIPFEDFRELVAQKERTHQPAVQATVDPIDKGPIPIRPTPPNVPVPRPQPVQQTKKTDAAEPDQSPRQDKPVEDVADPAEQVESQSPRLAKAPPIRQAPSIAPVDTQQPPKPSPPAEGPDQPGVIVTQPEAKSARTDPGDPVHQPEANRPQPIAPTPDPPAPVAAPRDLDDETHQPAEADVTSDGPPTTQRRAEGPDPQVGPPSQKIPTDAPPRDEGGPADRIPSKTRNPVEDGQPADTPPVTGPDKPEANPTTQGDAPGQAPPSADDQPSPQRPRADPQEATPTTAPRDRSEVPPTLPDFKEVRVSPGKVLTGPGLQVFTAVPDISTTSWLVSGPTAQNPRARITFDRTGKVKNVVLLRSTGHRNLDNPVLAAFYRFNAKGKALEQVKDTFDITITLLLKGDPEEKDEDDE